MGHQELPSDTVSMTIFRCRVQCYLMATKYVFAVGNLRQLPLLDYLDSSKELAKLSRLEVRQLGFRISPIRVIF